MRAARLIACAWILLALMAAVAFCMWNGKDDPEDMTLEQALYALRSGRNTQVAAQMIGRRMMEGWQALRDAENAGGRDGMIVRHVLSYLKKESAK